MAASTIRRVAGNAASLLASDLVNRAATFVLYALVARNLGAYHFGQLALGFTLFYLFQVLAGAGLKTLITREVAKDRSRTGLYLINGSAVVAVTSLISIATLWLLVAAMGYSEDTAEVIRLLSLGLLPYSLSVVAQSVFQAWERMHYIALANVGVNSAKVGVAFLLLSQGHGLHQLIVLLLIAYISIMVIEWLFLLRLLAVPRAGIDTRFGMSLVRATGPFLGIDGTIAAMTSISVILLSRFADETQVGIFSAASQLMVPVMLFFQSAALSVFPIMCRRFDPNLVSLKRIAGHLIGFLMAVAVPTLILLFFLAEEVLVLLYGQRDFLTSAVALRIMVWNVILVAITTVLGQVLLASLRERVTLRIVAIDALAGLAFGLVLISQFGVIGAAATALLMRVVDFVQHYVAVSRLPSRVSLAGQAWKPAVAGGCMIACIALTAGQSMLLTTIYAGTAYVAVLAVLIIWTAGGIDGLRAVLLKLRSD